MGADLLLLHGFTNTGRCWEPVRAALAARGYRGAVAAPDLRGHGDASAARPVDIDAVLADLRVLPAPGATVCGYSMGGRLALHLALAEPGRVARLVLIGASPGLAGGGERTARAAADEGLAVELERDGLDAFRARWAALPLWEGQPATVAAAADRDRARNDAAGLAAALRGLGTGTLPSLWERLAELRCEAVLAAGERDRRYRDVAARMARAIPHARVVALPAAGHAAHLEAPDAVAALVAPRAPGRDRVQV